MEGEKGNYRERSVAGLPQGQGHGQGDFRGHRPLDSTAKEFEKVGKRRGICSKVNGRKAVGRMTHELDVLGKEARESELP